MTECRLSLSGLGCEQTAHISSPSVFPKVVFHRPCCVCVCVNACVRARVRACVRPRRADPEGGREDDDDDGDNNMTTITISSISTSISTTLILTISILTNNAW